MPRDLLRDDGENLAVRSFLMLYGGLSGGKSVTVGHMRDHMEMSGWGGLWPDWVKSTHDDSHLTKGGAQDWLRHLFGLEPKASLAPKEPIAWLCHNDPDVASAFKWPQPGADYANMTCYACGGKHLPVYADLPAEDA